MDDRQQRGERHARTHVPLAPPSPYDGLEEAALSLLLPGAGQLRAGRWHRGVVMVAVTLGVATLGAVLPLRGVAALAGALARTRTIDGMLAVDLALLTFRVYAVVDAYRCARRPLRQRGHRAALPRTGRERGVVALSAMLLAILLLLPHAGVAYYGLHARALLTDVFTARAAAAPATDTARLRPVDEPSETAPAMWPSGPGFEGRERVTVLLLGGDAGPMRTGLRTDTVMVATLRPRTGEADLISIPRNLMRVPLPAWVPNTWRCDCYPRPINSLYDFYRGRTELVPEGVDPGAAVVTGAIQELLGLRIDHHVLLDHAAFVEVVDVLGGVTIEVHERVYDQLDSPDEGEWDAIDLRPGPHHLDGRQALVYVRTRRQGSDYVRMGRQRCFLAAVAQQLDLSTVVRTFPTMASILRRSVRTDMPRDLVPAAIELALTLDVRDVGVLGLTPPAFNDGWDDGYPIVDVDAVRAAVRQLVSSGPPPASVMTARPSPSPTTSPTPGATPPATLADACA
ncbi:MAG TPA: LCP family protein [Nitriliruptorales bacterium]|nr:LCP family protein [Nitriliruptorales bacterium]